MRKKCSARGRKGSQVSKEKWEGVIRGIEERIIIWNRFLIWALFAIGWKCLENFTSKFLRKMPKAMFVPLTAFSSSIYFGKIFLNVIKKKSPEKAWPSRVHRLKIDRGFSIKSFLFAVYFSDNFCRIRLRVLEVLDRSQRRALPTQRRISEFEQQKSNVGKIRKENKRRCKRTTLEIIVLQSGRTLLFGLGKFLKETLWLFLTIRAITA